MSVTDRKVGRYKEEVAGLAGTLPDVAEAYHRFTGVCFAPGELDERTKHLIALGVALYANNEVCTYYHLQEARSKGASDRQIMEAAAVAAAAASGHALSQGVTRVQEALHAGIPQSGTMRHDGIAVGMQDYLQETEFAMDLDLEGMVYAGLGPVSPSY